MIKKQLLTKVLTLLLLLGSGVGQAWASTVDDLQVIDANFTFTPAEDLTDGQLYSGSKILSLGGSTLRNSNSIQIKNNRQIAFKVNAGATVTITFVANGERAMQLGTSSAGTDLATSTNGTLTKKIDGNNTLLYLSASSDLYMTELKVTYGPTETIWTGTSIGKEKYASGWWEDFSQYYTIQKGKEIEFSFTNYTDKQETWFNWILVVANGQTRGSSSYAEYFVLRADNHAWGTNHNVPKMEYQNGASWDNFKTDMDGAQVVVKVSFSGTKFFVYATMTNNGHKYILTETTTALGTEQTSANLFFTVQESAMVNFSNSANRDACELNTSFDSNKGSLVMTNSDGVIVPSGTYVGFGTDVTITATPKNDYLFYGFNGSYQTNNRVFTAGSNGSSNTFYGNFVSKFAQNTVEYNLLDLKKTSGMQTMVTGASQDDEFGQVVYSSSNNKIVRINPSTGALTFLKTGIASITGTVGSASDSYSIKIVADEATADLSVDNTTYTVTGAGKLPSNLVSEVPYITMQYGANGETPIVRNLSSINSSYNGVLGTAVIGAAEGNVGSLLPNSGSRPTSGTYYVFKPQINGQLTVSGYFSGSHSAWFYKCDAEGEELLSSKQAGVITKTNNDTKGSQTIDVEAGKVYYLMAILDGSNQNVFYLNSFKFVPTLKLANKSYLLSPKTNGSAIEIPVPAVEGLSGDQTVVYSVADDAITDGFSQLSASISSDGTKIIINSPTDADGGAIVVYATVGDNTLEYVVNVPYIGNHVWDFHHMGDKSENKNDGRWVYGYEVRNSTQIATPIVYIQGTVDGNNAPLIEETNGLSIQTNAANKLGVAVVGATDSRVFAGKNDELDAKKSADKSIVTEVEHVAFRNSVLTIPNVKKDWFVKIYLDPHTGNSHDYGSGSDFTVENLADLTGKKIDPTHYIMSYGTQWRDRVNGNEDLTSNGKYAGCLIFRVAPPSGQETADVKIHFSDQGWDKLVHLEVTNSYYSEFRLGGTGTNEVAVDYARWNHSFLRRVKSDGSIRQEARIRYSGHPNVLAENAKPVSYFNGGNEGVAFDEDHMEFNWTSGGGVKYTGTDFVATSGVGDIKLVYKAIYSGEVFEGGSWVKKEAYVLNANENWIVVGQLDEQKYPYTWDFEAYNMNKPTTNKTVDMCAATTQAMYGAWTDKTTNDLVDVLNSTNATTKGWNLNESPFYTIDADGNKTYHTIKKPTFAQGSQLTYGTTTIPETKGLGISVAEYPAGDKSSIRQISLDGNSLYVGGRYGSSKCYIKIPAVNEGMYVFVKASKDRTVTATNATVDNSFAPFSDNDAVKGVAKVTVFKVTADGDVDLTFDGRTNIYKIGVTDQVKDVTYYGWTTESRAIDIDHNETASFSAKTKVYKLTKDAGWNTTYSVQVENGSKADLGTQVYVPAGNGIVIENTDVNWNPTMGDTDKSTATKVPLFVPAVNIATHPADMTGNLLLATTKPGEATVTISPSRVYDSDQYYVMANYYYRVGRENNKLSDNKVWAYPAMYRYMGTAASPANKAYLYFSDAAESLSKARNSVATMFDEDEATGIDQITSEMDIIDNNQDVYYNVNGQLINGKPNTRGIYIKNGVKYYNK